MIHYSGSNVSASRFACHLLVKIRRYSANLRDKSPLHQVEPDRQVSRRVSHKDMKYSDRRVSRLADPRRRNRAAPHRKFWIETRRISPRIRSNADSRREKSAACSRIRQIMDVERNFHMKISKQQERNLWEKISSLLVMVELRRKYQLLHLKMQDCRKLCRTFSHPAI